MLYLQVYGHGWLGRAITLGPNTRAMCWHPNMHADTWYRLTPNPYNIPAKYFPYINIVFAILEIPALIINNNLVHVLTVMRLVSHHAFVPFFVAHIHSNIILTLWPLINVIATGLAIYSYSLTDSIWMPMATLGTLLSGFINVWFVVMQLHLLFRQPIIRQEQAYEGRQPRLV